MDKLIELSPESPFNPANEPSKQAELGTAQQDAQPRQDHRTTPAA